MKIFFFLNDNLGNFVILLRKYLFARKTQNVVFSAILVRLIMWWITGVYLCLWEPLRTSSFYFTLPCYHTAPCLVSICLIIQFHCYFISPLLQIKDLRLRQLQEEMVQFIFSTHRLFIAIVDCKKWLISIFSNEYINCKRISYILYVILIYAE